VRYVPLEELLRASDIVTLHCPLSPASRHLIDGPRLSLMRAGALLVNTSRGALVDTPAVIEALKSKHLGGVAIDVYEEEERFFFEDHSADILQDDTFARLLTFPNVVVTGHQAFFTENALRDIARTTIDNITAFERGEPLVNAVP
jgi:D-lactate dehydrogenase